MSIIVQKFGGTSVGNVERIKKAALIAQSAINKGDQIIIVVSAMAGVTNQLITFCNEVANLDNIANLAEYDVALASGEIVSAALLALSMQSLGIKARSICAWQLPIITDSAHSNAIVKSIDSTELIRCLEQGVVPIIPGFQGITDEKYYTTLGRGGSDTTASLIAASVKADRCDIYTDVDGVFSADPRIVANAKLLRYIGFDEMLAMTSSGAKVIHPRCVEVAMRYKIPIRVLSSFENEERGGTMITNKDDIMEHRIITGITANKDLLRLNVNRSLVDPSMICCLLTKNNIHIEFMFSSTQDECDFIIQLSNRRRLEAIISEQKINFTIDTNVSTVSVVGYAIKNDCGFINKILESLRAESITLFAMQTSEIKLTLFTQDSQAEKIIHICHRLLEESKDF